MPTGLPDWWKKFYWAGQEEGVWGIMPWAARAGYYRGIVFYGSIVQGSDWYKEIITVPSGKTFYLALFVIGSEDDTALYWVDLKDQIGAHYAETVVKQGIVIPYNPPIPVPAGRTLYLYTYGYNVTCGFYATIVGFLY
ncbi:hypothetical protein J7J18_02565 [bacterium]|nr:hypothetical protein [bacterium]